MTNRASSTAKIPEIRTIIDPLYEPLKFTVYRKCDCIERLLTDAHLPHCFSPYLLLDVERLSKVCEIIEQLLQSVSRVDNLKELSVSRVDNLKELTEDFKRLTEDLRESIKSYVGAKDHNDLHNDLHKTLSENREELMGKYNEIKDLGSQIIKAILYGNSKLNEEGFYKLSTYFQLDHAFTVRCPCCNNECLMSEEERIYYNLQSLLKTFEVERSRWLYQSGALHRVHPSATHTRLAHIIGCFIVAVNALQHVTVFPSNKIATKLGSYLLMRGKLHEFLAAVFLHDLGHPPLSHVLEINPFIELDHVDITRSLISEDEDHNTGINWYHWTFYILKLKAMLDFLKRPENESLMQVRDSRAASSALKRLEEESLKLMSNVITVHGVLVNCGINPKLTADILSENPKGSYDDVDLRDIHFLHALLDSRIDIDRIDHVRRDSAACGLSLTSFRVKELLQGISIVLPDSGLWKQIDMRASEEPNGSPSNGNKESKPDFCVLVSPEGLMYVLDLLTSRRIIFKSVLFGDVNNFINGVINQITACAVRHLPHLKNLLPFITDQILAHFFSNELLLGTQVPRLNKLLQGKADFSAYREPLRWQLKRTHCISRDNLMEIYREIEKLNDRYSQYSGDLPAIIFYTNFDFCKTEESSSNLPKQAPQKNGSAQPSEGLTSQASNAAQSSGVQDADSLIDLDKYVHKDKDQEQNECKKWEQFLVYGKQYADGELHRFRDLARQEYPGSLREFFPAPLNEEETKNLFYVWVHRGLSWNDYQDIITKINKYITSRVSPKPHK